MNDTTFITLIHIFTGMIAHLANVKAPVVMTVTDWIKTFYGRDSFDTDLDTGDNVMQNDIINQSL